MEDVRTLTSLALKLRSNHNIPLRQPILNYAYCGVYCLSKEHKRLFAQAINIYDQGYDFADSNYYEGLEIAPPDEEGWYYEGDLKNIWIALDFNIPDWLLKIGEQAKERRKECARRKQLGLPYIN